MKKWKKILAVMLCLLFVQAPVISLTEPVVAEAAAVKSGLKKENGKYYFYVKGQRVKNTWKNVKTTSGGKTTVSRYYFGKDGAAYAGKRVNGMYVPAVKKINGKYYGFGVAARMLKGIYVVNDRFCVFNSKTGVLDSAKSNQLRKASTYERDAAQLRKLLGKPRKTQVLDSCYGDGKDLMLYYPNFMVSLFKNTKGKEIVLGVLSK
ncbi:MAG: hypothetical protein Q4D16_25835 [Eubacteriales bacterium]|nr:hypothetical protein [Eubacteriales bacterium]